MHASASSQNVLGRVTSNLYEISDEGGLVNTNARQGMEHCVQITELQKLSGTICGILADIQQNIRRSHNLRLPLSVNTLNDKGSHTLPKHQIYLVDCRQTCPHSFQMTLPATLSSALIIAKGLVGQANTSQCVPTTDSITTVHGIQQIQATVFSELGSAHTVMTKLPGSNGQMICSKCTMNQWCNTSFSENAMIFFILVPATGLFLLHIYMSHL